MNSPLVWFQVFQLIKDGAALATFVMGILLWRRIDRACRLITWWVLVAGVVDLMAIRIGFRDDQARFLIVQFWFPMSAPLAMGALGALQGTVTRRDIFRLTGLGYVFGWALLLLSVEDITKPPQYTSELHTILLLAASAITLVRRASLARQDLMHDPGFVLSSAVMTFAVPTLFISVVTREWGAAHTEWLHRYLGMHSIIATLCFLTLMYAIRLSASAGRVARTG